MAATRRASRQLARLQLALLLAAQLPHAQWVAMPKMAADPAVVGGGFGQSVAIDGGRMIVGASHGGGTGAAFKFEACVEPAAEAECQAAAQAVGLSVGGGGFAFSGAYAESGCHTFAAGADVGMAFWSTSVSGPLDYTQHVAGVRRVCASGSIFGAEPLLGAGAPSGAGFGHSVAIGNGVIVVGAVGDGDGGASSGSAHVFDRRWTKLTASDAAANALFGSSVAIGNGVIVVGAVGAGVGGAAYAFERDASGVWAETAKLNASNAAAGDQFGCAVAVEDGIAVVGTPHTSGAAEGFEAATWDTEGIVTPVLSTQPWTRHTGSTPSSSTGPAAAHEGSWYLFTEASSQFNMEFGLDIVPPLNAGSSYVLEFWFHMFGQTMGTLTVEVASMADARPDTQSDPTAGAAAASAAVPAAPLTYSEGFETPTWDTNGVIAQEATSPVPWSHGTGTTPSFDTGPAAAHEGSSYLFTEASSQLNMEFILAVVPTFTAGQIVLFDFWCHMYGATMGTLSVEMLDPSLPASTAPEVLWSLTGEQQTSMAETWTQITIPVTPTVDSLLAIRGVTGTNFYSDMSIDAVGVRPVCVAGDTTAFEQCISSEVTTGCCSGGCAASTAACYYCRAPADGGPQCFTNSTAVDVCRQQHGCWDARLWLPPAPAPTDSAWSVVWSTAEQQHAAMGDAWTKATIALAPQDTSVLQIRGVTGSNFYSDIAIDAVGLMLGDAVLVDATLSDAAIQTGSRVQITAVQTVLEGAFAAFAGTAYAWDAGMVALLGTEQTVVEKHNGIFGITGLPVTYLPSAAVTAVQIYSANATSAMHNRAYAFERDASGSWAQTYEFIPSDAAVDDRFGHSVAISNGVAVIGAFGDDHGGSSTGSAYAFERDASRAWSETFKLTASDAAADDQFGYSVALDKGVAVVGAIGAGVGGAAYTFERDSTGVWFQSHIFSASDAAVDDKFGCSVGIENGVVLVGAVEDDDGGAGSGSAYAFKCASCARYTTAQVANFHTVMPTFQYTLHPLQPVLPPPLVAEGFEAPTWDAAGVIAQDAASQVPWTRGTNLTPSSDTGPDAAYEGSYYLFTEASSNFNTEFILAFGGSPDVGSSYVLEFWYHMYGADMGSLTVELGTPDGVREYFLTSCQTWANARAECQAGGGDLAVIPDAVRNADVTAFMGSHANYGSCEGPYPWIGANGCSGSTCTWVDGTPWSYTGPGFAIDDPNLHLYAANGNWGTWGNTNTAMGICERTVAAITGRRLQAAPAVVTEDFETATWTTAGLLAPNAASTNPWTHQTGGTPSSSTGPDVTTVGAYDGTYYIFTEASSHFLEDFVLDVVPVLAAGSTNSLDFWYHMHGADTGTLSVQMADYGSTTWASVWSLTGQQQPLMTDAWLQASVQISPTVESVLQIKGLTGASYTSDMCIDTVSLAVSVGRRLQVGADPCAGTAVDLLDGGSISSHLGGGQYTNSMTCAWNLICSSGNPTLSFSTFDTESNFDFVRVDTTGDGNTDTDLHGATIPPAQTGVGTMVVVFTSDASVTMGGFDATFTCGAGGGAVPPQTETYTWSVLWSMSGEQHAVAADAWTQAAVALSAPIGWRMLLRQTSPNFEPASTWRDYNAGQYSGDFGELNDLEACRQDDGKLHLKLTWPDLSTESNEWKQTSNPVTTSGSVQGYEAIDVHYTEAWSGLEHNGNQCTMDGNAGAHWWYGVGCGVSHQGPNTWPGPQPNHVVTMVEFYAMCAVDSSVLRIKGVTDVTFKSDMAIDAVAIYTNASWTARQAALSAPAAANTYGVQFDTPGAHSTATVIDQGAHAGTDVVGLGAAPGTSLELDVVYTFQFERNDGAAYADLERILTGVLLADRSGAAQAPTSATIFGFDIELCMGNKYISAAADSGTAPCRLCSQDVALSELSVSVCTACTIANESSCTNATCADGYHSYSNSTCCKETSEVRSGGRCACSVGYNLCGTSCSPSEPCAAGTQLIACGSSCLDQNRVAECTPCADGKVSSTGGVCRLCPQSRIPNPLRSACEACPAGTESLTDDTVCLPCGPGQISAGGGDGNLCAGCPDGKVSNAAHSACEFCSPGAYASVDHSNCTLCELGKVRSTGISCSDCPAPNVVNDARTTCGRCAAGEQPNVNRTRCNPCQGTTYSTIGLCDVCASPMVVDDTKQRCSACGPGKEPNNDRNGCVDCSGTTFSTFGIACLDCAEPSVVDTGRTACSSCSAGKGPNPTRDGCDDCENSTFSTFGAACSDCPDPSIVDAGHTTCVSCSAGKGPNSNRTGCVDCEGNFYSVFGWCQECLPPNQVATGRSGCLSPSLCAAGTMCPTTSCVDADQCIPCGTGEVSISGGQCGACTELGKVANGDHSFCQSCLPGSAPRIDRSACFDCMQSNYSSLGIQCSRCPAPNIVNDGHTTCTACAAGNGPNANHTGCVGCTGTTFSSTGVACVECAPGKLPNPGYSNCDSCNAGRYRSSGPDCMSCQVGKLPNDEQSACEDCVGNRVPNLEQTACEACLPGESPSANKTHCVCQVGSYNQAELPPIMCFDYDVVSEMAPPEASASGCIQCADCLECTDDIVVLKQGYQLLVKEQSITAPRHAFKCKHEAACAAQTLRALGGSTSKQLIAKDCVNGTKGHLCAICNDGWKKNLVGLCKICDSSNGGPFNPLFLVPVGMIIAYVSLRSILARKRQKRRKKFGAAKALFAELDRDGGGSLSRDELKEGLKLLGHNASEKMVVHLIEQVDLDHNGQVNEHEFVAWMESAKSNVEKTMMVARIGLGLGQILSKQPDVLQSQELIAQFKDYPWLAIFSFNVGWIMPVCQVDYTQSFLLNTVFFPMTLMGLVGVTWAGNPKSAAEKAHKQAQNEAQQEGGNEKTKKNADQSKSDEDLVAETKMSKHADLYFAFFISYPTMTQTFFGHFNCRYLKEEVLGSDEAILEASIAVLDKDYSEPCYETTWWILAVISGLGIVFISFGVPFGMYYWMTQEMNKQMDEVRYGTDPDHGTDDKRDREKDDPFYPGNESNLYPDGKPRVLAFRDFAHRFKFMSGEFRHDAYYAECIDLVRKLCMSGLLSLIEPGSVFQGYMAVLFSFTFVLIHVGVWPYLYTSANMLKLFAEVEVFLVTLTGLILKISPSKRAGGLGDGFGWTGSLYGDLLWAMLLFTICPLVGVVVYKSPIEKAQWHLHKMAKVSLIGNQSEAAARRRALRRHMRSHVLAEQMPSTSEIFMMIDADQSGTISTEGFHTWWLASGAKPQAFEQFVEAFQVINAFHPEHPGLAKEEFIKVLVAVAADKWCQATDELTGKACYSHTDTGEVSWEDPGITCVPMFLAESGVGSAQRAGEESSQRRVRPTKDGPRPTTFETENPLHVDQQERRPPPGLPPPGFDGGHTQLPQPAQQQAMSQPAQQQGRMPPPGLPPPPTLPPHSFGDGEPPWHEAATTARTLFAEISLGRHEIQFEEFEHWWLESGGSTERLRNVEFAFKIFEMQDGVPGVAEREFSEAILAAAQEDWAEQTDPRTGRRAYVNSLTSAKTRELIGDEYLAAFLELSGISDRRHSAEESMGNPLLGPPPPDDVWEPPPPGDVWEPPPPEDEWEEDEWQETAV